MFASLRGLVLLGTLTAGHGQFLSRGDGTSFFSSFSSSSSWVQGRDGQMHKQTQESSTEIVQHPNGMKQKQTKSVCRDGHCTKVVEEFAPGAMQDRQRMPFLHRVSNAGVLHANMQALMQRLTGDDPWNRMLQGPNVIVSFPQEEPKVVPPPVMVGFAEPMLQHRWSPAMDFFKDFFKDDLSAGEAPMGPASDRINLGQDRVDRIPEMRAVPVAPPSHKNLEARKSNSRNTMLTRMAAISCGSLMALMTVMLFAKFYRLSGIHAFARERPLQGLAEPLAAGESPVLDVQKNAVNSGAVQADERADLKAATQMYLCRVYVRFFD